MFKKKNANSFTEKDVDYGVLQALSRDFMIIAVLDAETGNYSVSRCEPQSVKVLQKYISDNLTFEEIVERYVEDHIYPEDKESAVSAFKLSNMRSELANKEYYSMIVRKVEVGRIRYIRVDVRRFDPESDKTILFSVRDVDREVQKERSRQEELSEAYKAVERASLAKNKFMYNMSHDIRSPLNAIMGYTTVAADNYDDPRMLKKCLGRIDDAGHQVLNIISEILDINEYEEKSINVTEHTLTISDLERQITLTVDTLMHDKKLDFLVNNKDGSNPSLIMDDAHMVRAVVNLINHSARYTEAGGTVSLTISALVALDPDYRRYTFVIEDNGVAVNEGDESINILIARNILRSLGGVLKAETKPDGGNRFTIDIEFKIAFMSGKEIPEPEENSREDKLRMIAGKRILLVDDSQVSSDIAVTILSGLGVEVECAYDGSTAIDMICGGEVGYYDMILMDIEMPQMNGIETTREIRGLHRPDARKIPIVALTASVFEKTRQDAYGAGMNDFVTKPVNVVQLEEVLAKAFR